MTVDQDPKTESVNILPYPSVLVGRDDERKIFFSKIPGDKFEAKVAIDVLQHITIDYPQDKIECDRCKSNTKLDGKRWCADCIEICEPTPITEKELAKSRVKTEKRKQRVADATAEWDAQQGKSDESAPAEEESDADEKSIEEPKQKSPVKHTGRPKTKTGIPCPHCGSDYTHLRRQYQKGAGQTAKSYSCTDCKKWWTTVDGVMQDKPPVGGNIKLKEKLDAIKKYVEKHPDSRVALEQHIKNQEVKEVSKCKKCGRMLKKFERCPCKKKTKEVAKRVDEDLKEHGFDKPIKKILETLFCAEKTTAQYKTTDGRKIVVELIDVEGTQYATKAWVE